MATIQKELDNQNQVVKAWKDRINYVDYGALVFAEYCLSYSFNKDNIGDAIYYLGLIELEGPKKQVPALEERLNAYEEANRAFVAILNQAQKDGNRQNLFKMDSYKEQYIQQIKDMAYYKELYKKEDINIPYLDTQIDQALDILKSHSKEKRADFSAVIKACTAK
jgi:hypothetical protein